MTKHGSHENSVDRNLRLGKTEVRMHDRTPSAPHLTDSERLDRLRLIRSDNIGPRGIMAQTPQAVFRRVLISTGCPTPRS